MVTWKQESSQTAACVGSSQGLTPWVQEVSASNTEDGSHLHALNATWPSRGWKRPSGPWDKKMESRRVRNQKAILWGQMSEEFEPQEVKMWKLERQIKDIVKIQFHTGTIAEVHRTDFSHQVSRSARDGFSHWASSLRSSRQCSSPWASSLRSSRQCSPPEMVQQEVCNSTCRGSQTELDSNWVSR